MRFYLLTTFLILSLTGFSQKNKIEDIDKYVKNINSNPTLEVSEYDWSKITGTHIDHGAILKIWKKENQIVKIKEEFGASYGRHTRLLYLKNNEPIKGIETEENFEIKNDEINHSSLNTQFQMKIYVTGFNDIIKEYVFDVQKEGKRKMTESYCDLNSVFAILDKTKDL